MWVSVCFDRCSIGVGSIKAFLTDRICFLIDRKSCREFFKNCSSRVQTHFFKSFQLFLSPYNSVKAPIHFFVVFLHFFLQGFSLPRPVRPLYPSFCIYFHFSCIKSCIIWEISNLWIFWIFDELSLFFHNWSMGFCWGIL